jgi:hypothetical protein
MEAPQSKKAILSRNYKDVIFLAPVHEVLEVKGKLTYNEGDQAFSNLKFKKELLQEFPHLKEKASKFDFIYLMKLHRSFKELRREIEELEENRKAIPIVLMIAKKERK